MRRHIKIAIGITMMGLFALIFWQAAPEVARPGMAAWVGDMIRIRHPIIAVLM